MISLNPSLIHKVPEGISCLFHYYKKNQMTTTTNENKSKFDNPQRQSPFWTLSMPIINIWKANHVLKF